jgi:hypothetical protein
VVLRFTISPLGVQFIQYVNNRFDNSAGVTKDFGADGTATFFLEGKAYLAIANAMTGNVRVIEVDPGVETSE